MVRDAREHIYAIDQEDAKQNRSINIRIQYFLNTLYHPKHAKIVSLHYKPQKAKAAIHSDANHAQQAVHIVVRD